MEILPNENIDYLNDILLDENGKLKILSAKVYHKINPNHLRLFGHKYGIYSFPTIELAEWLIDNFDLSECIEIGAGNGILAQYLGIIATDSKQQTHNTETNFLYQLMKQPVIKYGENVEKLNTIEAIKEYKPRTVIAQWVTHIYDSDEPFRGGNIYGVDEQFILDNVNTYIFIGNESVHMHKPILGHPHYRIPADWIVSRAKHPEKNIIYIWDNNI